MKMLICDDDPEFLEQIHTFLQRNLPYSCQMELTDGRDALFRLLQEDTRYDLLLMDIRLEEDNGIEAARQVLEQYPQIPVIFITGYPDLYFERVFLTLRPWGFVKKPVNWDLLLALVQKCLRRQEENRKQFLSVRTKQGVAQIPMKEIRYVESQGHMIMFHMREEIYETYGRLTETQKQLPLYFICCHKSFLVNPAYIKTYETRQFVMENGVRIPISQMKRKEARQKFFSWLEHLREEVF